jgi:hypothetical protein
MANKKTKKKPAKLKKTAARPQAKKAKKKSAPKRPIPKKKLATKKPRLKKSAAQAKPAAKKATAVKPAVNVTRRPQRRSQRLDADALDIRRPGSRSAGQSGDLQGLPDVEGADSESVDELIEEGNAFEADAVAGVESADDSDEKEVHTHEVPEDDVPGEYLDEK